MTPVDRVVCKWRVMAYASFASETGKKIISGEATLEELAAIADDLGAPALPDSGRQEYLQSVINGILFR